MCTCKQMIPLSVKELKFHLNRIIMTAAGHTFPVVVGKGRAMG